MVVQNIQIKGEVVCISDTEWQYLEFLADELS